MQILTFFTTKEWGCWLFAKYIDALLEYLVSGGNLRIWSIDFSFYFILCYFILLIFCYIFYPFNKIWWLNLNIILTWILNLNTIFQFWLRYNLSLSINLFLNRKSLIFLDFELNKFIHKCLEKNISDEELISLFCRKGVRALSIWTWVINSIVTWYFLTFYMLESGSNAFSAHIMLTG